MKHNNLYIFYDGWACRNKFATYTIRIQYTETATSLILYVWTSNIAQPIAYVDHGFSPKIWLLAGVASWNVSGSFLAPFGCQRLVFRSFFGSLRGPSPPWLALSKHYFDLASPSGWFMVAFGLLLAACDSQFGVLCVPFWWCGPPQTRQRRLSGGLGVGCVGPFWSPVGSLSAAFCVSSCFCGLDDILNSLNSMQPSIIRGDIGRPHIGFA